MKQGNQNLSAQHAKEEICGESCQGSRAISQLPLKS